MSTFAPGGFHPAIVPGWAPLGPIGATEDGVTFTMNRTREDEVPSYVVVRPHRSPHRAPDGSVVCCDQAQVCWPHPCPWHTRSTGGGNPPL